MGREVILLLFMLLALGLPHFLALDRYVTVDETKWLMRSGGFYTALAHLDFIRTFQREHPGVTVTWAGTAGYLWRFPGYFKIATEPTPGVTLFHHLLQDYQKQPLDLLVAGRVFVVTANVTSVALAFLVMVRLVGALAAFFAFMLVAFDPYLVGLTRLLHPDSLLSTFTFLSLISFLGYLTLGRQKGYLLLSGIAAGLAWLTKSPAFFLAPFFGLMLQVEKLKEGYRESLTYNFTIRNLWRTYSPLLLWFAIATAVFVLLWPAMWVDPLGSLKRVFSLASTYASEGHDLRVFFNGNLYESGQSAWYFYPLSYLWRTTPVTLIGLGLALLAALMPGRLSISPLRLKLVLSLLLFAALFTFLISLAEKKFDRYQLPAFIPLDLVAALGWLSLVETLQIRTRRPLLAAGLAGAIVLAQVIGVFQTAPYYLDYYNPMLGGGRKAPQVMMIGWEEGLDQAARYLNNLPEKGRAVAWYGDGCFSYFYNGTTIPLDQNFSLSDLRKNDYVVIYRDQWQRQLPNPEFLAFFERFDPIYVVKLGAIEYVRLYSMRQAPVSSSDPARGFFPHGEVLYASP